MLKNAMATMVLNVVFFIFGRLWVVEACCEAANPYNMQKYAFSLTIPNFWSYYSDIIKKNDYICAKFPLEVRVKNKLIY